MPVPGPVLSVSVGTSESSDEESDLERGIGFGNLPYTDGDIIDANTNDDSVKFVGSPIPSMQEDLDDVDVDDDENGGQNENMGEVDDDASFRNLDSAEGDDKSTTSSTRSSSKQCRYNWRLYAPATNNVAHFLRWAIVGGSKYAHEQSDEELHDSLAGLARCLHLLRDYKIHYGMPDRGGARDQEYVLREVGHILWSSMKSDSYFITHSSHSFTRLFGISMGVVRPCGHWNLLCKKQQKG